MNSYKELIVWQKSIELCSKVYKITKFFPKNELYGITSQIRRSCVAIPSNIAEGYRRGHRSEYIQFLQVAFASGAELETQLLISLNVSYLSKVQYNDLTSLLDIVMKMLNKLINSLLHPTP
jgi:four helix bundle protein